MMQGKDAELPMQMYHRIYRFAVRNIPARQIAATLNVPTKTVQRIIERFEEAKRSPQPKTIKPKALKKSQPDFLDVYLLPKTQYVVIDMAGSCIEEHCEKLRAELEKIMSSEWKTAAVVMRDVQAIDETGLSTILQFHQAFTARGRFTAILDPSIKIEEFLAEHEVDDKMPIFGTEKSFEDRAFRIGRNKQGRL